MWALHDASVTFERPTGVRVCGPCPSSVPSLASDLSPLCRLRTMPMGPDIWCGPAVTSRRGGAAVAVARRPTGRGQRRQRRVQRPVPGAAPRSPIYQSCSLSISVHPHHASYTHSAAWTARLCAAAPFSPGMAAVPLCGAAPCSTSDIEPTPDRPRLERRRWRGRTWRGWARTGSR